jgi:hypothetical protein
VEKFSYLNDEVKLLLRIIKRSFQFRFQFHTAQRERTGEVNHLTRLGSAFHTPLGYDINIFCAAAGEWYWNPKLG